MKTDVLLPFGEVRLSRSEMNRLIRTVELGAGITTAGRRSPVRRPAAVIAAAAALCAVTLTAGAVLNWDMPSFVNSGKAVSRVHALAVRDWLNELKAENIAKIDVPEGAVSDVSFTEHDIGYLESVFVPLDETLDCGDRSLHVSGYIYDGLTALIMYEVSFAGSAPENIGLTFGFSAKDINSHFTPVTLSTEGNTLYCAGRLYAEMPDVQTDMEIQSIINISENDKELKPTGLLRFTVSQPENAEVIRLESVNKTVCDDENQYVFLKRFVLSSLGAKMEVIEDMSLADGDVYSYDRRVYPIYVIMKDGTVIDLSDYTGNAGGGTGIIRGDGLLKMEYWFGQNMNVIDIAKVKSVQIFNEVFEIG